MSRETSSSVTVPVLHGVSAAELARRNDLTELVVRSFDELRVPLLRYLFELRAASARWRGSSAGGIFIPVSTSGPGKVPRQSARLAIPGGAQFSMAHDLPIVIQIV
jgi:hypothetical protein